MIYFIQELNHFIHGNWLSKVEYILGNKLFIFHWVQSSDCRKKELDADDIEDFPMLANISSILAKDCQRLLDFLITQALPLG